MKLKKAVVPVAGFGTRMLPATKAVPKELLPVVDIPTVQYVVQEAVDSGVQEVIFVTGRGKDAIEDHFDVVPEVEQLLEQRGQRELLEELNRIASMIEVVSVRQKRPLGLGHAVLCARDLVGEEPFAVLLADDLIDAEPPCLKQLMEVFEEKKQSVIALMTVSREEVHRYGVIAGAKLSARLYEVKDLVEKPSAKEAPSSLAIIGRYILLPEIFPILQGLPPGRSGEIQLTDGLVELARKRKVYGHVFSGERHDVGDKLGFIQANIAYGLKRPDLRPALESYLRGLLK